MKDFNKYFIVGTNSDALHDTMNGTVTGELIRCKECKHGKADGDGTIECTFWDFMDHTHSNEPNGFCYRAERRGK